MSCNPARPVQNYSSMLAFDLELKTRFFPNDQSYINAGAYEYLQAIKSYLFTSNSSTHCWVPKMNIHNNIRVFCSQQASFDDVRKEQDRTHLLRNFGTVFKISFCELKDKKCSNSFINFIFFKFYISILYIYVFMHKKNKNRMLYQYFYLKYIQL